MGGGPGGDSSDVVIWAETKTDTGSVYYYNTKTRSTSWDRPEGQGIKIMSHEEVRRDGFLYFLSTHLSIA